MARQEKKHLIHSTPHTLTLGAEDDFIELESSDKPESFSYEEEAQPSWFSRTLTFRLDSSAKQQQSHAAELESEAEGRSQRRKRRSNSFMLVEMQERRDSTSAKCLDQSLLAATDSSSLTGFSSDMTSTSSAMMNVIKINGTILPETEYLVERKLQQDCSFFYRSLDAEGSTLASERTHESTRFRGLLNDSYQHLFHYRDAVDVLSPPVLSRYRARYQQLNQDLPFVSSDENDIASPVLDPSHDLHLTAVEENNVGATQRVLQSPSVIADSVHLSSLLYKHQGRILLKLPQDHVRLLMDPDLPVGTLSVCQWRSPREEEQDIRCGRSFTKSRDDCESGTARSIKTKDQGSCCGFCQRPPQRSMQGRPSLQYVLTVPEDLYRKVVGDMSQSIRYPLCNIGSCCHEDDRVDIGVAVLIVTVVMIILLLVGAAFGDS